MYKHTRKSSGEREGRATQGGNHGHVDAIRTSRAGAGQPICMVQRPDTVSLVPSASHIAGVGAQPTQLIVTMLLCCKSL